jgi:hypothetical protein
VLYASSTMAKRLLFSAILLSGALSGVLSAQVPSSLQGSVTLLSSREGIPEVSVTLCADAGREAVSVSTGESQLLSRDQIREIRIPSPGEPGQITVTSVTADCPNARRTTTDNGGRFAFDGVSPGGYKIHAQRNGYIGLPVRESQAPPVVVTHDVIVTSPQAVSDVSISMIKAGAIAGTVRDANGKPFVLADVQVLRAKERAVLAMRQTDDRGQYRLFGLPPGEFIVLVREGPITVRAPLPDGAVRMTVTKSLNAPTYHRSEVSPADAKTIILREGEEVSGIDVVMRGLP